MLSAALAYGNQLDVRTGRSGSTTLMQAPHGGTTECRVNYADKPMKSIRSCKNSGRQTAEQST